MAAATPVLADVPQGDEPVAVPRAIKQGIDFSYVDPDMNNVARRHQRPQNWLQRILSFDFSGGRRGAPNVLFVQLGRGMQQYQNSYGCLPQCKISGRSGAQTRIDRQARASCCGGGSGCIRAGGYDEQLFQAVASYQTVHGIGPADGVAGKGDDRIR